MDKELKEKIEKKLEEQKEEEEMVKQFIEKIVEDAESELDNLFKRIQNKMNELEEEYSKTGEIPRFEEHLLDIWAVKIPLLMYNTGKALDNLIVDNELSKATYQNKYDEVITSLDEGTIPEKEAEARIKSIEEKYHTIIKNAVQRRIDRQLKTTQTLFDGLRKLLNLRIEELRVFGNEMYMEKSRFPNRDSDYNA